MKFADFAWVATTTCLVGQVVFGQPTTDENGCISPVLSLRNVARQTTLDGVAQLLKEVRDTVVKPSVETPPQLNTNPVFLLTSKTQLNTLCSYLFFSASGARRYCDRTSLFACLFFRCFFVRYAHCHFLEK